MRMEATIEAAGLRKSFWPVAALDGLSFTVLPGRVTGFVGPNDAGNSTSMRVILGLDAADAGSALVGGRPYRTGRFAAVPGSRTSPAWPPAPPR